MTSRIIGSARVTLLRHDFMIVKNEFRSAFSSWADRLLVGVVALIPLVALRASMAHQPFIPASLLITAVAAIFGASAAHLIQSRLDFHTYDGALAADALAAGPRRRYIVAAHLAAFAILTIGLSVIRSDLLGLGLVGYLAGTGCGHLAKRLMTRGEFPRRPIFARPIGAFLQRPIAGLAAALLLLPLLFLKSLDPSQLAAFIGFISAIAVLGLTMLDDAVIRFMTFSGYGSWTIIGLRLRAPLIFLAVTVPACLIVSDRLVAGIVGAVSLAAMVLMAVRILAYRIHPKRTADIIVSIGGAGICLAGFAVPLLLPVIAIALFWNLHRRAAAMTWMMT